MELLPGARSPVQNPGSESRFRIRPEPGAAAWWGEILLPQFQGSLTIRVVHRFFLLGPGISAPEFQPRNRRRPEDKYYKYPRGIIEKKISIFSKKATLILKSQFCQSLF